MHKKNTFWYFLLGVVGISAFWHTAIAGYKYYAYYRLNEEVMPTSMSWSVVEHGSAAYTLMAAYQFNVDQKNFQGSTDFASDIYLNYQTAEMAIDKVALQPWKVWYNKNNPEHSSLQKDFPFKQYVYAIILWGIFVYFIFLKYNLNSISLR